jgi:hypothetical protein
MRVRGKPSQRNLPQSHNLETSSSGSADRKPLLSLRAAVIFGSSLIIAVATGALIYVSGLRHASATPAAAVVAGVAAFVATVKLLDAIIAD